MLIRDYIAKKHTFIKYMITRQLKNSEKNIHNTKIFLSERFTKIFSKKNV